jgi:MFS family permease
MKNSFYGWWITIAAFVSFGLAVGVPYYGMPFFYDYYMKEFGWSRPDITLGFPLAAVFTLWVGPVLVHRFSPRRMILIGTTFTFLAFAGFGTMGGNLYFYYFLWVLYTVGYIFSGPIPHQVIISQWFKKRRGTAMAVAYLGVGLFGGISAKYIAQPLTSAFGFRGALIGIGLLMFLVWPLALFVMKDRPSDMGQNPDGAPLVDNTPTVSEPPKSFGYLLRQRAFWLLLIGSFCSIGSIGSINQHMKLIFLDDFEKFGLTADPNYQILLDNMFSTALLYIMFSSIAGRIIMGYLADRFTKKNVMVITYFLVALTIPLLLRVVPPGTPYVFSILFGFGLGADYMLIPLMAAEQFGVASLSRAMGIILPTDTIGQTWFPYIVAQLRQYFGDYDHALVAVFGLAMLGAIAILLMPNPEKKKKEPIHAAEPSPSGITPRQRPATGD